jgi:2-polyprenyl-3-methyl-5-hydroxy-6-metoxy-1,4-benzoquinol methylase
MPEELQHCPNCTGSKFKSIFHDGQHGIVKCSHCGLIFTNPRATSNEIVDLYGDSYMANLDSVRSLLLSICEKRLAFVEGYKNSGRMLDVGCGNGYFLSTAERNGWEVFGTEVSSYSIEYCENNFGIQVQRGEIFDTAYVDNYFDAITLWHTFEHVKDPISYLQEFNRILKPDGLIFILVPNEKFLLNYLKGWNWIGKSEILEHLFFFSADTLDSMLVKSGFKAIHRSIGTIESIRNCFRQKVINTFSMVGKVIYYLFKANVGETIQIVAAKDGIKYQ